MYILEYNIAGGAERLHDWGFEVDKLKIRNIRVCEFADWVVGTTSDASANYSSM